MPLYVGVAFKVPSNTVEYWPGFSNFSLCLLFFKKRVGYSPFSSLCLARKERTDVLNLFHLVFQWFLVSFILPLTHISDTETAVHMYIKCDLQTFVFEKIMSDDLDCVSWGLRVMHSLNISTINQKTIVITQLFNST